MPIISKGGRRSSIDAHLLVNTSRYKKRDITDFLSNEYKEYAKYVIATRCCPGMDGLKVGARKVMHAAFVGAMKNGQKVKMLNLIGDVYSYTKFMHGDSGLTSSIFTKSAEFSDNLNPLEIDGQHGHLRSPKAQSAPRYLSIRLSKYAKILKEDYNLLEYVFDEGEYLEPTVYLPVIPLVLTSAQIGLAPGYKFQTTVGYNPLNVIDACTEYLKKGEIKTQMKPYVRGCRTDSFSYNKNTGRWTSRGLYSLDFRNDVVKITDLPFDVTFKDFEENLNNLLDAGTIREWKNFTQGDSLDYRVWFPKTKLTALAKPGVALDSLEKMLLIYTVLEPNILNILDESGKLVHYSDEYELTRKFVEWRIIKYAARKDRLVEVLEKKFQSNDCICKFIDLVNSGKIKIQNRKKADIKKDLDANSLPASVLSVEISKLTDEEKTELRKKNEEIKKELAYIKATDIKDMYLDDLKKLRKELASDFPEMK